jgi:hypothetical protein
MEYTRYLDFRGENPDILSMSFLEKRPFPGALFGIGVILLFGGCTTAPPPVKQDDPPGYRIFKTVKEIPLVPENDESPRMTLSYTLLDTGISDQMRDLLRNLLYDGVGPEEYENILSAYYQTQYAESAAFAAPPRESMNWEYTEEILPQVLSPDIVVISRSRDYYLGGAHGMQEKAYFVITLRGPKQLKLADILRDGAGPELRARMEDALRGSRGLGRGEPLSEGGFFEDSAEIPDNFFLTREGLGFRWDPYEIAPYSMGPVEVTLPYETIKPLLSAGELGSLIP